MKILKRRFYNIKNRVKANKGAGYTGDTPQWKRDALAAAGAPFGLTGPQTALVVYHPEVQSDAYGRLGRYGDYEDLLDEVYGPD